MVGGTDRLGQTRVDAQKDREERYWKDFFRGNPLDKYGKTKVKKKWMTDKNLVWEIVN